jgi:HK97 family phage portal protein
MGLGELVGQLLTRDTKYTVEDTATGFTETFTAFGSIAPNWSTAGYRQSMGIPGVWRASVLIADLLGSLPWDALRTFGGREPEVIHSPLLTQPNPPQTRITTFSSLALDLLFHGNGIGVYTARNRQGWPTACVPVPAEGVGIRRARQWEDPWVAGEVLYDINGTVFSADDVLHIQGPTKPGSLRGMGVLENHLDTLDLARELNREARSVARSGGVPTGKLKVTNEEADENDLLEVKRKWLQSQRERTVAVLNATTDFEPLAWNPTDAQLIEARQFSLHETALLFGLDPSWLGVDSKSKTYSNIEQEGLNLMKPGIGLGAHVVRFEQALSLAFPAGTEVKANMDAILRSDTLTRFQAHEIGIRAGFETVNEVRELEDRAPLVEAPPQEA